MATKSAKSAAERTASKKARRTAQGLVRFSAWIPDTPEAREAVKRLAESLRAQCAESFGFPQSVGRD